MGEPAVGAGLTLDEDLYDVLAAHRAWVARLREVGLGLMPYHGCTRVFRTWPVAELVGAGETLDEQARALATWAREGFKLVLQEGPGEEFEVPARARRRRRRGRAAGDGEYVSQPVTEADMRHGRVRIPQDGSKGLFPGEKGAVPVVLRGTTLEAHWSPRYGRHSADGERSGELRVGHEALKGVVELGERLVLSNKDGTLHLE
jgi:hypothetical protein